MERGEGAYFRSMFKLILWPICLIFILVWRKEDLFFMNLDKFHELYISN